MLLSGGVTCMQAGAWAVLFCGTSEQKGRGDAVAKLYLSSKPGGWWV